MTWDQFKDLLPVLTLVLGGVLGFTGDWLLDKRRANRDRAKWSADYQRQVLADIPVLVDDFEASMESIVMPQVRAFKTDSWRRPDPTSDLVVRHLRTRRLLKAALSAVADPDLRKAGIHYLEVTLPAVQEVPETISAAEANAQIAKALADRIPTVERLQDLVGEALRKSY
jgi:hypothetical protein